MPSFQPFWLFTILHLDKKRARKAWGVERPHYDVRIVNSWYMYRETLYLFIPFSPCLYISRRISLLTVVVGANTFFPFGSSCGICTYVSLSILRFFLSSHFSSAYALRCIGWTIRPWYIMNLFLHCWWIGHARAQELRNWQDEGRGHFSSRHNATFSSFHRSQCFTSLFSSIHMLFSVPAIFSFVSFHLITTLTAYATGLSVYFVQSRNESLENREKLQLYWENLSTRNRWKKHWRQVKQSLGAIYKMKFPRKKIAVLVAGLREHLWIPRSRIDLFCL